AELPFPAPPPSTALLLPWLQSLKGWSLRQTRGGSLALTGTASALLAMQLVFAGAVAAQEVRGRVSAAETGEPLPGAFVLLLDSAGERRAAGLAGTDGGFRVSINAPGVYRLRVEMLGYATHEEEVGELLTDEVVVREV